MCHSKVIGRLALLVLLWPLLITAAFGQDSAAPAAGEFRLNGVLISPAGRSALINGKVSREGERVGRAEILAIEEKGVRLIIGADEFTVLVGSSAVVYRRPAIESAEYKVKRGDTLSRIAERFLDDGVTMNQMMIALFEANPRAFDGNINRIRAGVALQIPNREAIDHHTLETATAEVIRQTQLWRGAKSQPARPARATMPEKYGPVGGGETLSRIAAQLSPDGVTLNQMMIALFEANPQAFNGNINFLLEGAVLRVPGSEVLRDQATGPATAEVLRHTELWRRGQRSQSTETVTLMTALNRD